MRAYQHTYPALGVGMICFQQALSIPPQPPSNDRSTWRSTGRGLHTECSQRTTTVIKNPYLDKTRLVFMQRCSQQCTFGGWTPLCPIDTEHHHLPSMQTEPGYSICEQLVSGSWCLHLVAKRRKIPILCQQLNSTISAVPDSKHNHCIPTHLPSFHFPDSWHNHQVECHD